MTPPVVQRFAFCEDGCWSHIDPDDLRESYTERDEKVCPNCDTVIPEQYIPDDY